MWPGLGLQTALTPNSGVRSFASAMDESRMERELSSPYTSSALPTGQASICNCPQSWIAVHHCRVWQYPLVELRYLQLMVLVRCSAKLACQRLFIKGKIAKELGSDRETAANCASEEIWRGDLMECVVNLGGGTVCKSTERAAQQRADKRSAGRPRCGRCPRQHSRALAQPCTAGGGSCAAGGSW